MGCAESQALDPDIETLSPFTVSPPAKLSLYEDKILLESEFTALRKSVTEAIHQTEVMKTQMDLCQSSLYPAEFESMRSQADDVMNWMEMDVRDGDRLVEVLMKVHPACKDAANLLLAESSRLRRQEASIQDYLPYFRQRYDLLNRYWADIVTVWRDCESHAVNLKADLAGRIGALEDFLGKKSDNLEALRQEMRRLAKLDMHTFLTEQWTLARQIAVYSEQAALKKQRDVVTEKNRCVRLLQTDLEEITRKYQSAVNTPEVRQLELDIRTRAEEEFQIRLRNHVEMQAEDLASLLHRYMDEESKCMAEEPGKLKDSALTQLTQDFNTQIHTQRALYEEKLTDLQVKLQTSQGQIHTLEADSAAREQKAAKSLLELTKQHKNTQETTNRLLNELKAQLQSTAEQATRLQSLLNQKNEETEACKHRQFAEIRARNSQFEDLRLQYDSARRQLERLTREIREKDALLADFEIQKEQNYCKIGELEKYAESLVIKLQEAQLVEEFLRKSMSFQPSSMQVSTSKRYLEALSLRDAKITELLESQKAAERQYQAWTQRLLLKHVFSLASGRISRIKGVFLGRWRLYCAFACNSGLTGSVSRGFEQEIELIFAQIREELMQKCLLAPICERAREQVPPLSPPQAFNMLENIIEQKYEADFGPFRTQHPQSFPDFALSLLSKAYQHTDFAYQTLGQGLLALQTSQPSAQFLCRLFHIHTREPYPVEVGLVVERACGELGKLEKQVGQRPVSEGIGGSVFLLHVVTCLYQLFRNDQASGMEVLRRLKPDTVSLEDFVSFNVCYCLGKTGVTAEAVFASLNTLHSGDIPITELVHGLRDCMTIWLTEEDLKEAFLHISQGRNTISKSVFSAYFDFKRYLKLALTEPYIVSKCRLLRTIGDVYFLREQQIASELLHFLPADLIQVSFIEAVRKLDSEVDLERLALIWEVAERYGQGQATRQSALRALLTCKVGAYASFAYYDDRLDPSVLPVKEQVLPYSAGDLIR